MIRKETMSSICIGLIRAVEKEHQLLREILINVTNEIGIGISYNIDWDEPIWEKNDKNMLFFSICDSSTRSNCEMLLLADGCFYNDKTNSVPLANRLDSLKRIAATILGLGYSIEFYVGASGAALEDYSESSVSLRNIGDYIASNLYSYKNYVIRSLHVIVTLA